jgi:hypothetical protein
MTMDELRRRFATLDSIPTPIDRSELERRLRAAGHTPTRPVIARDVRPVVGTSPVFRRSPVLVALIVVGLLIVALLGAAVVGSRVAPAPPLVTPPARIVVGPSPTPPDPTSASSVPASPFCTGVEPPATVRISDLVLPDIDTGPLGRPVVAGCALWMPSGDNGGGIHRVDLLTGAVTNANPAEVIWDVDVDGDQLWALGGPVTSASGDTSDSALFRLDPATGEVLTELPLESHGELMRIAGDRAWVGGYRSGLKAIDLSTGATVATPITEGTERTIETGAGAVWALTSGAEGTRLLRVDISTGEVTVVPIDASSIDFAIADEHLYIGAGQGEVQQIDPVSGAIVTSVRLDDSDDVGISLVAEGSSVWALPIRMVPFGNEYRLVSTELVEIDGATGVIGDRIEYQGSQPVDLWATSGSLWLSQADRPLVRFELPGRP